MDELFKYSAWLLYTSLSFCVLMRMIFKILSNEHRTVDTTLYCKTFMQKIAKLAEIRQKLMQRLYFVLAVRSYDRMTVIGWALYVNLFRTPKVTWRNMRLENKAFKKSAN